MDAAYLRAAHPKPFVILGTPLRPFALGHELLLQRFENKFSIESTDDPGIPDLMIAIWLCSRPYSPDVSINDFKIPLRARALAWLFGKSHVHAAYDQFGDYITYHTEIPDFFPTNQAPSKQENGAPTIQAVKVSLIANLHKTEIEALNTPFSLAVWDHLTWAEAQGSVQLVDEKQRALHAKAREMEEKLVALGKKVRG